MAYQSHFRILSHFQAVDLKSKIGHVALLFIVLTPKINCGLGWPREFGGAFIQRPVDKKSTCFFSNYIFWPMLHNMA